MARKRTDNRTESVIESAGDRFMAALGLDVWRLSQTRATRQTPGFPDRLYSSVGDRVWVWWEAKTEVGVQRDGQAAFQRACEAVGQEYIMGTDDVLHEWAIRHGYVERISANGLRVIRRAA